VRLEPRGPDATATFHDAFDENPDAAASAPGRVNLLGEHTDYNDGLCLPIAIGFRASVAVRRNESGRLRLVSAQRPGEQVDVPLDALAPGTVSGWAAYPASAVWAHGAGLSGLDVAVDSDVPEGAGLSSSAALTCATLGALGHPVDLDLARLAQRAENDFVGVPCGLMDQLASTLSCADAALLFDVAAMTATPVVFDLPRQGLELLVVDTCAPHVLADGSYARRRQECHDAARALGVPSLRLAVALDGLAEPGLSRARHVTTEIARVSRAVDLLRRGDARAVGPLLSASHASLRDDFEVTVPHLDVAVVAAEQAGAHGARMTGGGFGGSVIALVETAAAEAVATAVEQAFGARGWAEPRWFLARAEAGLRVGS